jgi:hypothetical protein
MIKQNEQHEPRYLKPGAMFGTRHRAKRNNTKHTIQTTSIISNMDPNKKKIGENPGAREGLAVPTI